jgi:hypothetical protein
MKETASDLADRRSLTSRPALPAPATTESDFRPELAVLDALPEVAQKIL